MARLSPAVSGTLSGHGGWRIVPGLSQWRKPPTIGEKRRVKGSEPAPRPSASQSMVQTTAFWKTTGWVHQSPIFESPPRSEVAEISSSPPPA